MPLGHVLITVILILLLYCLLPTCIIYFCHCCGILLAILGYPYELRLTPGSVSLYVPGADPPQEQHEQQGAPRGGGNRLGDRRREGRDGHGDHGGH